MCHAIVWYHAICQHLDDTLSSLISCDTATLTGDECLAHDTPIVSLPLSGSCFPCKDEHLNKKQDCKPQGNTNKDLDTKLQNSQNDETSPWAHEPELIPGYHTHLYPRFDTYEEPTSWLDLEEFEVEIADYEHLLSSERPRHDTPASSPELEKDWFRREFAFPDSPTLGYVAGRWDPVRRSVPGRWQSMIPVPARTEAKERSWSDSDMELFDHLTF